MRNWYHDNEQRYLDLIRDNWEDICEGRALIEVYENGDKTEGRGPMTLTGRFRNVQDAYKVREGKGVQGRDRHGSPYIDTEVRILKIADIAGEAQAGTFDEFIMQLPADHPCSYLQHGTTDEYEAYLRLKEKFG